MDEYISRQEVVKEIKSRIYAADDAWESGYNTAMAEIMEWIKHIPAADVQPVKHGQWIIDYAEGKKIYHAHCSECYKEPDRNIGGDYYIDKLSDFCPNCGALMDVVYKDDAMTRLYYYQMGLSTLHLLQQKQMNDLIMSIHAPEIPAPPPAFGVPMPDCWYTCPSPNEDKTDKDPYKEAFMDGYMAAVDYFIKHELDRIEPKEK